MLHEHAIALPSEQGLLQHELLSLLKQDHHLAQFVLVEPLLLLPNVHSPLGFLPSIQIEQVPHFLDGVRFEIVHVHLVLLVLLLGVEHSGLAHAAVDGD